ncbi:MAG TPA: DUF5710 domain-containing protein [Steroidobacteraceae bacterium]|jgi:hypothetical protein|nr:DUF5710 domain-containing protein [Steroidobacteraceae bacterium]
MDRVDLYVSPEEYAEVRALGACWDQSAACWYLNAAMDPRRFERWLPDSAGAGAGASVSGEGDGDAEREAFTIRSDQAYVVCTASTCCSCRRGIDVLAIYCRRGTASEEPLEQFTVQGIWAMEPGLARQLERWPSFRFDARQGCYANHCPLCGAPQDEAALHDEPDQPFFSIDPADTQSLRLTPLTGIVQLSGDYGVEV